MNKDIKVAASILCADFAKLGEEIKKCEDAHVDIIHVDVMDGHFVPNITIGPIIVEAIRPLTNLPIETHLMIENPGLFIEDFISAGADIISIHVECYASLKEENLEFEKYLHGINSIDTDRIRIDIQRIRQQGKKAFLVINPETSLCIDFLLSDIDGVLIMSVNPGFAKQKFMPKVLSKIQQLRAEFDGDIAIDGGINELTAPQAVKAGANILATASYFFGSPKPKELVKEIKSLLVSQ